MGKFNVSKDDTKDILTITSNQAGLAMTFSEFKKQNPGLIITQIVDSAKDPSSQEITYTFELGKDDSGRINQSLLYIPRTDITANSFAELYAAGLTSVQIVFSVQDYKDEEYYYNEGLKC